MTLLSEAFDPSKFPPPPSNLEVALDLARAGAFVFPCQSEGEDKKKPCNKVFWRNVSTRDEVAIRRFWERFPDAVPGIDCAKSGFLVIDCDCRPVSGLAWFTAHAARFGDDLSVPPIVDTPSGGRHFYFRNPVPPFTNARGSFPSKPECGIDIRAHGGFVIGPGATFADGSGSYRDQGSIFDAGEPPQWLCDLLTPPVAQRTVVAFTSSAQPVSDARLAAYGEAALRELLSDLAGKLPGERNEQTNLIAFRAGQLVGGGCLTASEAQSALEQAALSWGIHPRDKALGPKGTIARAIKAGEAKPRGPEDSDPPAVEILLTTSAPQEYIDPETGEILPAQLAPPLGCGELPDHLTRVPGLVGAITDWITDTAIYPQRGLSLGAALAVVGTAAGRHLAGPNRCGTHLYVVGLAPSGAGKNHPLSQIATILSAADMRQHIGPSQFISMPAVINFLCRAPLSVCAMDEFGSFLKRINSKRASGFEGAISGMLRSAWGASFSAMTTPEWAGRSTQTIFSPALSIFGVSTAKEFYDSMEGGDVTNGVLNRFLLIETKRRPVERQPLADASAVPPQISEALKQIYGRNPLAQLCQSTMSPAYDTLAISVEAERVRRGFVEELHARGDADPGLDPFLARTAENALRLATIVTIGCGEREIGAGAMSWAREFASWSTDRLAEGAGLYISDSDNQATAQAIRRAIQEKGGRIKRRDLIRALAHRYKTREIDEVIRGLAEAESIVVEKEMAGPNGGRPSTYYRFGD